MLDFFSLKEIHALLLSCPRNKQYTCFKFGQIQPLLSHKALEGYSCLFMCTKLPSYYALQASPYMMTVLIIPTDIIIDQVKVRNLLEKSCDVKIAVANFGIA